MLLLKKLKDAVDVSQWIFDTIFIGGGTPSLLNGRQIENNISAI